MSERITIYVVCGYDIEDHWNLAAYHDEAAARKRADELNAERKHPDWEPYYDVEALDVQ